MAGFRKYHKEDNVSYALGVTLVFELLKYKTEYVNKVYIHSAMNEGDTLNKLIKICKMHSIDVVYTDKIFNVLSQKENCYVIGEFRKFEGNLDNNMSHIVLVNPSNAGNMGTIMRTALGFGINQIAIVRQAVDAFDPRVVRASMGAIFSTDFVYFDSFYEYRDKYSDRELYTFMLDAKKKIYDVKPHDKFSLIFGNEAAGLPDEFAEVGISVVIPHTAAIDSLNLPIAAGIAMYHFTQTSVI